MEKCDRKFNGSELQKTCGEEGSRAVSVRRWKAARNPSNIPYFSLCHIFASVFASFSFFLPKIWFTFFSMNMARGRWLTGGHFFVYITCVQIPGEERIWLAQFGSDAYFVPITCGQSCRVTCYNHGHWNPSLVDGLSSPKKRFIVGWADSTKTPTVLVLFRPPYPLLELWTLQDTPD